MPTGFQGGGGVDWEAIFKSRLAQQARQNPALAARVQNDPKTGAGAALGGGVTPVRRIADQVGSVINGGQPAIKAGGPSGGGGSGVISSAASTPTTQQTTQVGKGSSDAYPKQQSDNKFGFNMQKNPILRNGKIGDRRDWFAGRNSNIAIQDLAGDPEQINYQWANSKGYGRGIEGQLNKYVDPYAIGLASGQTFATDEDYLGYVGGFNERAVSGSTGQSTFDPRAVIKRVFGASGTVPTEPGAAAKAGGMDVIGQKLFGGQNATNVSGQVGDTLKFLQASLTGVVSPTVLDSYLNLIEEQGRAFLQYKNSPNGGKTPMNFGQWVLERLGPNGGL